MDKDELELRFISFVTMLGTAAMQQMGKIADPLSGGIKRELGAAKATIDLLMVLKEKTKNNLSKDEESSLNNILTNLQLNYVDESQKPEEEKKSEEKESEQPKEENKEGSRS